MSLILYINGEQADLPPGQVIAQTRQVNDIASLQNRQAGYTNKFSLPKTAHNVKLMEFLTLPGNTSTIPYQKTPCSLYGHTGECFVYNGWAQITDGGDSYECVIYDGIIDLYKAIENKSLGDLNLEELNHTKDIDTVITSWNPAAGKKYRYILADYNGRTGDVNPEPGSLYYPQPNVEYLVPSVNVAWLWDKIFTEHQATCTGSVFNTENFKNLWMTYPQGMITGDAPQTLFEPTEYGYDGSAAPGSNIGFYHVGYPNQSPTDVMLLNNRHIKVEQSGYYKVVVSGSFNSISAFGTHKRSKVYIGKNVPVLQPHMVPQFKLLMDEIQHQATFNAERTIYLNAQDSICIVVTKASNETSAGGFALVGNQQEFNLEFIRINQNEYDFKAALADFSIRDFVNEIVHRFGLTLFKDKYTNSYEFLTLHEILQDNAPVDWSKKFSKKISENYIYGSYAQRNWFRYNYSDKEATHSDYYLEAANANQPESRDVVKSKIYSPDRYAIKYINRDSRVYRMFEKETVENPAEGEEPVKYKALDKRYYFMRAIERNEIIVLRSPSVQDIGANDAYWAESFWKLPFEDILQDYYGPMRGILQNAQVVTAQLWLTDVDIANLDFRKLYYIEQLGSYFILNKINNYLPGRPTQCELVRIQPGLDAFEPQQPIAITKVEVQNHTVRIYFDLNVMASIVNLQVSQNGFETASNFPLGANNNPRFYDSTPPGNFSIRLQAGGYNSNSVDITIPSNTTIIP
ncbi:hypothetical protein AM493_13915 [Flavobacterium akiainvivens]|uniref:Uncharacterized protein n=1 Tax=Flavobacterium akiainvivens TaxID=1202724 RepID=A0A0N0RQW0_9FLAO|nr:hypothetical protein [Flavobacterium akiainvivens]KOS07006.1 hypothetical protein AM493_13915 [Flavobacterium akiainvivens]SFQ59285.1 hypothetical protein SAMN05444144_10994 [Flavobacterium akiainvivens]